MKFSTAAAVISASSGVAGTHASNVVAPWPWQAPKLHRAATNKGVRVVSRETLQVQEEKVILARADDATRQQVYRRLPDRPSILLGDHRGVLVVAVTLPRINGDQELYQEPSEDEASLVAVKIIRKDRVGGNEDPLCEISAMQALGQDYQNVTGCIEALDDNDHFFIVSPWMQGGDLNSRILPGLGLPEPEAQAIFKSMASNLKYLQDKHVCHRDLKPANILMANNSTSLLSDMAMSRRISVSEHGVVHPMIPLGVCGTLPFMPPEVFGNSDLDGFKLDIWSLGITLFYMLTGQVLYHSPQDVIYRHFITHGGLHPANDDFNDTWINYAEGLQDRFQNMTEDELREECRNHDIPPSSGNKAELVARLVRAHGWLGTLVEKIHVVQNLSQTSRDLLYGMLKSSPTERLALGEMRQHPWFTHLAA